MYSDKLYIEVGKAISIIQIVDNIFKTVLLLVFPGTEINDLYTMQRNDRKLCRATLGKLILILRKRVILSDDFEEILNKYLTNRNSLIHNWDEIEGWDEEEKAIEFTINFQKYGVFLTKTFVGFIRAWMEQAEFSDFGKKYPDAEMFFASVDSKWKNLIHEFIEDVKAK